MNQQPTLEQLEAAKAILDDNRFYDKEKDEYVIYFRTQEEADRFTAVIQQYCPEDLKTTIIN